MTRIIVKSLLWDDYNVEHIKRHNVAKNEVERAVKHIAWHKRTYHGRYLATGRSGSRILSIVIRRKKQTTYYVVTARDASREERRKLYEKEV